MGSFSLGDICPQRVLQLKDLTPFPWGLVKGRRQEALNYHMGKIYEVSFVTQYYSDVSSRACV